ncbi:hypothetical protein [Paraglaciecola sp.]|uniref:hypothetical protein n=1 Tax=Paraglaciecola sp. TaxID=1920173 RepID=UPI0030F4A458
MEDIISAYILSTRKQYKSGDLSSMYSKLFKYIDLSLKKLNVECIYTTSFSKHRACENIEFNGKNCLVYDQYLGQTFNMFNRILLEDKPTDAIFSYAHKLMGEYFNRYNYIREAAACGVLYSETRKALLSDGYVDDKRRRYTFIQEFFVMAHEAYHMILRESEDIRAEGMYNIDVYANRRRERTSILSQIPREEWNSLHTDEYREKWLTDEELEKEARDYDQDSQNEVEERINNLLENDENLREELCCDYYAASMVINICHFVFKIDICEILEAIYIATYHLRSLRILEIGCSNYIENGKLGNSNVDSKNPNQFIVESEETLSLIIRSQAMLQRALDLFDFYLGENSIIKTLMPTNSDRDVDKVKFHDDLMSSQQLHYKTIHDTVEQVIGNGLYNGMLEKEIVRREQNQVEFKRFLSSLSELESATNIGLSALAVDNFFGAAALEEQKLKFYNFN